MPDRDEDVSESNPEAEHLKMCGSVTLDDGREVPGCWVEKDEDMSAARGGRAMIEHVSAECGEDDCYCPDDVFWARMLGDNDPCAPGKDWVAAAFGELGDADA